MPWAKLDDALWAHPKVLIVGNEATGVWARCISWSSQQMTDGFVPLGALRMIAGSRLRTVAGVLVAAKLLDDKPGPEGAAGYWIHDFLLYNPSREFTMNERAHRAEKKDPEITRAVRRRDGSLCRYCRVRVNWKDRRGATGGTYDQVIPGRAGGVANLVVACRRCNSRKKDQTPEQAEMVLLPEPTPEDLARDLAQDLDTAKSEPSPDLAPEGDVPGRVSGRDRVPGPKDLDLSQPPTEGAA